MAGPGAMALDAGGFSVRYAAPEGETTVWEDAQAKLGNVTPKPKKQEAPKWEPANQTLDGGGDDAGEEDEDDDAFLQQYREARMQEMKDAATPFEGPIAADAYTTKVTEASRDGRAVVLCMVRRSSSDDSEYAEDADVLDGLRRLAGQHRGTSFVWGDVDQLVGPEFPKAHLPCVLVYRETDVAATLAGRSALGLPHIERANAADAADAIAKVLRASSARHGEQWLA